MSDTLRAFIDKRTQEGNFSTPTEYVRHLVREDQKREAERQLEALLLEGLASDLSENSLDNFLDTLRARIHTAMRKKG